MDRADNLPVSPGKLFAARIKSANLSVNDVAFLTGVDRRTVWRWTTGRSEIPNYAVTIIRQSEQLQRLTSRLTSE